MTLLIGDSGNQAHCVVMPVMAPAGSIEKNDDANIKRHGIVWDLLRKNR